MKKNKITVIEGAAKITKPGEVAVEGKGAGEISGQAHHRCDRRPAAGVAGH